MSKRALQSRKQVCQLCDFITAKQPSIRPSLRTLKSIQSSRQFTTSRNSCLQNTQFLAAKPIQKSKTTSPATPVKQGGVPVVHATQEELKAALQQARTSVNFILTLERIPTEEETLEALLNCEVLSKLILDYESPESKKDPVSALLQLDQTTKNSPLSQIPPTLLPIIDELSELAYSVIKHPTVFIAPKALELYVSTQSSLRRPQTIPAAFHLYAHKPLPKAGSTPITYRTPNPNRVGNAIPILIAEAALQSAMSAKQMTTAMDLIETSYGTSSFRRAKFVRKGLFPTAGVAVAPLAAYTLASQLAIMQSTMDTQMATNVAFTGMLAYMGFTATIGIVAITTANDQMERVTWSQGLPLRERWIREEERAAVDAVAQAWGFRETWRRGEEEGMDWDALREWAGNRGMLLDAAELLEGME